MEQLLRPHDLPNHLDLVLAGWRARLRRDSSGGARSGARGLAEQRLVRALVFAGLDPRDEERKAALAAAAANHAAMEPLRGLDPDRRLRALVELRHARWDLIRPAAGGTSFDPEAALRFIMAIDQSMELAVRAAMDGCRREAAAT